jgi:hypothetical protein
MEEQGLLVSEYYRANRAFEVQEFEDEGPHYFIELENGSVLYLNGQYLYDYAEIEDDPEVNQPRRFPCTDFTLRRHRDTGAVMDIDCRGSVLDTASSLATKRVWDYLGDRNFDDGEIVADESYANLKTAFGLSG